MSCDITRISTQLSANHQATMVFAGTICKQRLSVHFCLICLDLLAKFGADGSNEPLSFASSVYCITCSLLRMNVQRWLCQLGNALECLPISEAQEMNDQHLTAIQPYVKLFDHLLNLLAPTMQIYAKLSLAQLPLEIQLTTLVCFCTEKYRYTLLSSSSSSRVYASLPVISCPAYRYSTRNEFFTWLT